MYAYLFYKNSHFLLFVFRSPTVVTAQPFWGLLGAGVPPLLGALPLVAYGVR